MNLRLAALLAKIKNPPKDSIILDCYNQGTFDDVAMTITTRIDANIYYLLERIEMQQNTDRVMQIGNTLDNSDRTFTNPERNRVYDINGISPTLKSTMADRRILEPQMLTMQRTEEAKQLRRVNGDVGVPFRSSKEYALKSDGVSNTLTTFTEKECLIAEPQPLVTRHPYQSFGKVKFTDVAPAILSTDFKPHLVKEPTSCAIRGRNPEGSPTTTEQRLEMGDNIANCLTSVQKDSLVAEPVQYYYRIRKLTPKECFRLMDVDDPDIDKLIEAKDAKGKPMLSKSASYKLSGNSIAISCLFHIFDSLFYGDNTNPDPQLTLF